MTSKAKLEALLAEHELHISKGSVQKAGRVIPKIIRALLDHIEESSPHIFDKVPAQQHLQGYDPFDKGRDLQGHDPAVSAPMKEFRTTYTVEVGNLTPDQVKEAFDPMKPCPPCDVSIPDNPVLIPEFKVEVVKAKRRPPARKKAEASSTAPAPKPSRRKPKAP